ncbi:hypothetical protein DMN91_007815 [Ooceraea biroi]|uniref:Uncharacterized protein n=1 Tax=Ooceraea biroi TaxID=2015173 RepID=A0A3L8DHD3_OOCBI|nr:hypothetical protein DMN91_007815 [Ooceraea biroi]
MKKHEAELAWIDQLTEEQPRKHLADRGLALEGILPTLRARLRNFEKQLESRNLPPSLNPEPQKGAMGIAEWQFSTPLAAGHPGKGVEAPADRECREAPGDREYREEGRGREPLQLFDHDFRPAAFENRGGDGRPSRNSTTEAYNMMRRWNLQFSDEVVTRTPF